MGHLRTRPTLRTPKQSSVSSVTRPNYWKMTLAIAVAHALDNHRPNFRRFVKGRGGCGNGYVGPQGCPQKMWITLTEFSALARRSLHCCKSVTGSGRRYLMNGSYQRSILD